MKKILVWVVGRGGLLGSHVVRSLAVQGPGLMVWDPGPNRIPWLEPERSLAELQAQANRFGRAASEAGLPWAVLWCAGAGVVGTSAEALALETTHLARVLGVLGSALPDLPAGAVVLASSAGGVYGESPDMPLTESSRCLPISAYGENKLRQEALLLEWARGFGRVSTLIARISNLYGPGQHLDKPHGLISHLSRSLLHRVPVNIYVPLDTLRDYIYAGDCAEQFVACLMRLGRDGPEHVTRIFHGGEAVTIAGIVAAFARIARGHPRIICSSDPRRHQQPLQLQFRSLVWKDVDSPVRTSLAVGIQRVHSHHLALFQQGRLCPPPKG